MACGDDDEEDEDGSRNAGFCVWREFSVDGLSLVGMKMDHRMTDSVCV